MATRIIAQYESQMATYIILNHQGRIRIEATGHGGRAIRTPLVTTEAEARRWVEQQVKPACPPEDAISL